MKTKNKHGRTGVKKYHPKRPLAEDQKAEAYERGWKKGMEQGVKAGRLQSRDVVNSSRNIRDARRRLEELLNGG